MSRFRGAQPKPSAFGGKDKTPPPTDYDRQPPVFSFEYMQAGTGYSVECCNAEHRASLAARMFHLSRVDWLTIRQAPRHGIGSEKIARNAIRPAIPAKVTDDAELIALRYQGLHPMVGFRDGRVFNVLFIDHTMDVYPH